MLTLVNSIIEKRIALALIVALWAVLFPHVGLTGHVIDTERMVFELDQTHTASLMYVIPPSQETYIPARRTITLVVTSYNSVPEQTDDTPFITALGTETRDGIIATNYLPFRTKVRFPDLYGDKVFVVEDRMNARYTKRADIWSDDLQFSKNFGARYVRMEIL